MARDTAAGVNRVLPAARRWPCDCCAVAIEERWRTIISFGRSRRAAKVAKLDPSLTFHELRRT
jgi:hypothetical protein